MAQPQKEQSTQRVPKIATSLESLPKDDESTMEAFIRTRCESTKATALKLKARTTTMVKDPEFKKIVISTAGGTVAFGAAGGAFGLASGVLVGSAVGLPPALLTFGLSIPVCGAVGGAGGLAVGTVVGGGAGGCGGIVAYKYRVEIQDGIVVVKVKAMNAANATKVKVFGLRDQATDAVASAKMKTAMLIHDTTAKAKSAAETAKTKASAKAREAFSLATTTRAGVTSTSAVAGGAICGTAGGATGTLVGAAVGVVPALFTFGLSIPIGATIGACCGTVAGGGAGVVGGGALGFGGYTYRKELGEAKTKIVAGAGEVPSKLLEAAGKVKSKVGSAAAQMTQSATDFVCGSTGGSESIEAA